MGMRRRGAAAAIIWQRQKRSVGERSKSPPSCTHGLIAAAAPSTRMGCGYRERVGDGGSPHEWRCRVRVAKADCHNTPSLSRILVGWCSSLRTHLAHALAQLFAVRPRARARLLSAFHAAPPQLGGACSSVHSSPSSALEASEAAAEAGPCRGEVGGRRIAAQHRGLPQVQHRAVRGAREEVHQPVAVGGHLRRGRVDLRALQPAPAHPRVGASRHRVVGLLGHPDGTIHSAHEDGDQPVRTDARGRGARQHAAQPTPRAPADAALVAGERLPLVPQGAVRPPRKELEEVLRVERAGDARHRGERQTDSD
eukprot:scaffold25235_cov68-Phaeocystis_antarctica.AAC.2